MSASDLLSPGQFYHGTTKYFRPGDMVTTDHDSKRYSESSRGHVYFSSHPGVASVYADVCDDPQPEHSRDDRYSVYEVKPTGDYEPDPQHSGKVENYDQEPNYRSAHPLQVVRRMPMSHYGIRDAKYMP